MQFVRMVNVGDTPYDFHQHSKKRVIEPGEEAMVPWDTATSLFGDPFTTDSVLDGARTRAFKQVRGIHNFSLGNMTEEQWEAIRPKIEVYDIESGNRVYMVIEDPEGIKGNDIPVATNAQQNQDFLLNQLASLQAQVAQLLALQTATPAPTAEGNGVLASTDAPGQPSTPTQGNTGQSGFTLPTTTEGITGITPVSVDSAGNISPAPGTDATPVTTGLPPAVAGEDGPKQVSTGTPEPKKRLTPRPDNGSK